MDFIQYNPANEPLLADEDSSDEMDIENIAHEYGNIETLIDFDTAEQIRVTRMEDVIEDITLDIQALDVSKKTQAYKKYNADQIERFIRIMQEEGLSVPKAAEVCGIPRSSAYQLRNEFNAGNGTVLPGNLPKRRNSPPKKFFPEHSAFLIKLFDENPSIVLEQAKEKLEQNFEGFSISLTGLHKHIREKCALSLKQASKYTIERDAPRTIDLRYDIINKWKEAGVDQRNCVFIDEAGFNSQLIRSRAWSKVGTPAKVSVNTQKGVNISIIGCIAPFGTVDFSKVEPLKKTDAAKIEKEFHSESNSKKRKALTQEATKPKPLRKGTTAYHIVKFMESVLNILDKHDKKVDLIHSSGYKPLFMPPYSPFLNPIEECWSKIKQNIRRNPLKKGDELTPRIAEACKTVTVEYCQGWIRHAETYWD
ncbi:hypothetical protein INT46_006435, partial [Mucor plumbeus]